MLKQGLNCVKSRIREAAAQAQAESWPRPKTYSWTAAFVLRVLFTVATCVVCVSEPATLTLGIFCVRKETSCDQNQLRSRTASTWISLHAQRDMFLQNDCCGLAPPDRLMHIKMLCFRHGDTLGSQSTRKKTWISIMINKQVHAIKTAAFSRCGHTWISLRAQSDIFMRQDCCVLTLQAQLDLSRGGHTWISLRANATCSCDKTAAFSRRKHTWISLRANATCSCDKTAAFSRRKHTWISLGAQRDMFV